jgi:hypothetical protein
LPGEGVLVWPMEFGRRDAEAQWLGTLHWQPLVNGYSGYRPPVSEMLAAVAASLPDPAAVDTLARLGVARWLVVHDAERDWLDGAPRDWSALESAGGAKRFETSGVRIHALPRPAADPPPALAPERGQTLFGTPTAALPERAHRLLPCLRQWGGAAARCFPEAAISLRVVSDLDAGAIVPSRRPPPRATPR